MQVSSSELARPNSVLAIVEDGLSSFGLSYDATFADLASRLGQLAERHHGEPIAINVKLGSRR